VFAFLATPSHAISCTFFHLLLVLHHGTCCLIYPFLLYNSLVTVHKYAKKKAYFVSIQTFDQIYYLTEGSGNTDQQEGSLQCIQHKKNCQKRISIEASISINDDYKVFN